MISLLSLAALTVAQDPFSTSAYVTAPTRDFDLQHVALVLAVNAEEHSYKGSSTNTFAALKSNPHLIIHAGTNLKITGISIDGKSAPFHREGDVVKIDVPSGLKRGAVINVKTAFESSQKQGGLIFDGGGWHWIQPTTFQPDRVGFWTQGETQGNRQWCPTWDYPNDFTTSETTTTVPAGWTVVSNGTLVGQTSNGSASTWHWQMKQPHATYLLSLVGGPFDIQKDTWRNKPLWYVVPKGQGHLINDSFGDTKDMLDFFSSTVGVEYAWPKYAQNAMIDFGGGMENVSSTTLGAGSLTDKREGFRNMASLNSHELGHQWFGDLATCSTWGDIWLNESFATFMEMIYMEHRRGEGQYDYECQNATEGYLGESRRYLRPLATKHYPNPDSVFDSHAYPKGGMILHTLRRKLGDELFYAGLKEYLTANRHQPADTFALKRAFYKACGVDLSLFWDQWILSPGHPVFTYSWTYAPASKTLTVEVQQAQEVSKGVPIYDTDLDIGVISGKTFTNRTVHVNAAKHSFSFTGIDQPTAVLLDPRRNLLREIKHDFTLEEQIAIATSSPNAAARGTALSAALGMNPNAEQVQTLANLVFADKGAFPVFRDIGRLAAMRNAAWRPNWRSMLSSEDFGRQATAVNALRNLQGLDAAQDAQDERLVVAKFKVGENFPFLRSAIVYLDASKHGDLLLQATSPTMGDLDVRRSALVKAVSSKVPGAERRVVEMLASKDYETMLAASSCLSLVPPSPETRAFAARVLAGNDWQLSGLVLDALERVKDAQAKGALEKMNAAAPQAMKDRAKKILENL